MDVIRHSDIGQDAWRVPAGYGVVERFVERLTAGGPDELQRKTAGCGIQSTGASYKLRSNGTGYKLHNNGTGYKFHSNGTGYNFHNRVLVTVCSL